MNNSDPKISNLADSTGWTTVSLANICNIVMGQSPSSSTYNDEGKGLPFFQGKAEFGRLYPSVKKWCSEPKKIAEQGDILLSIRAPVGPSNIASEKCIIGRGLAAIRGCEPIYQGYIFHFIRKLEPWLAQQGTGSTFAAVSGEFIRSIEIPLAPIAEQQQIAAKLDELLAQVDSIKTRLDAIPKILKRFRQSVLAAAVSGKLTEDWRNSEELVSWKQQLLENLVKKPNYGTSSKSQKEGKVPVLRMGNLQNGKLDWNDLVYTSDEEEIRKYRLFSGDVLFNRTNSPELVGKTSIYRDEREAIFAGYLIRVQCSKDLNPEFLNIHLNSPLAREYCQSVKSDGVSQSNINAQKLLGYPIHCPSISEQTEIVRRVEQFLVYADQIEQRVKDAQARVNHLTQAILAKAFRGELTADWRAQNLDLISGENSAEALLNNIQLERTAENTKSKSIIVRMKTRDSMTPKKIIPVYEALRAAGKALSGQELLKSAGYPSDASTQQLEQFFLDIRQQLELKTITRNRRENSDQDWFEVNTPEG